MSFVLYALGAGLFLWSGLMLLSGDTFATLDIAASLAGSGAFTIGLGALTGALDRVARAVGGVGRTGPTARSQRFAPPREDPAPDIVPVFLPRGPDPAHFGPSPEPKLNPVPESKPEPVLDRRPEPPLASPPLDAEPAEAKGASDEPGLSKRERRARKLLAKQQAAATVEPPSIVGPALGGGSSAGTPSRAGGEKPVDGDSARMTAASERGGDKAADRPADVLSAAEMFERARPIMPIRTQPALRAEPPRVAPPRGARPERPLPGPSETAPADATPDDRDSKPAVRIAAHASGLAPEVDQARGSAPDATASIAADAVEPEPEPARTPSEPPRPPKPTAPAGEPPAPPAPPRDEPKVPDWLARARARREARAKAEAPAVPAAAPALAANPAPEAPAITDPHPEPESVVRPIADEPTPGVVEPDPQAEEAGSTVVSEGEHNGVVYRFYDDGSVEAASAYGVRRFATVDELRATVQAARGADGLELPPGVAAAQDSDPSPSSEADPLDAALAELERQPAAIPELKIDPLDRPGSQGRR